MNVGGRGVVLAEVFRFWTRRGRGGARGMEINERSGAGLNLMEELFWKFFQVGEWELEADGSYS